ncbi:uncharacterized protein BDZ83DRAFT_186910 [Colletotrichum acutatum]|uniref:Uncharacterized protein n=1 Tax=Glomerella acutata TaxID=27357 RepID=A0AAD8XH28_GLOAC|nr:uncharacterized protein BDZ83DRAFT_186910 [Colletotrichum acutatum]KAK1727709.1 hypothetical protein BDZ83DRAFT_186910 [Colletotrichum acutatum]
MGKRNLTKWTATMIDLFSLPPRGARPAFLQLHAVHNHGSTQQALDHHLCRPFPDDGSMQPQRQNVRRKSQGPPFVHTPRCCIVVLSNLTITDSNMVHQHAAGAPQPNGKGQKTDCWLLDHMELEDVAGAERYGASSSSLRRLHRLWSSNASRRFSILVGWGYLSGLYLTLGNWGWSVSVLVRPPYPIEIRIRIRPLPKTNREKERRKKSRCLSTGSQRETESCVSSATDSGALERRGMTFDFGRFSSRAWNNGRWPGCQVRSPQIRCQSKYGYTNWSRNRALAP